MLFRSQQQQLRQRQQQQQLRQRQQQQQQQLRRLPQQPQRFKTGIMAYINNGISRSLKFTVNKMVGGLPVQGYPHLYNGQNYWGNALYPTLTDQQLQQLGDVDFMARYNAFVTYVEIGRAHV